MRPGGALFGHPDETLSSVFGKNAKLEVCAFCFYMCALLHMFDRGHCAESIEPDVGETKGGDPKSVGSVPPNSQAKEKYGDPRQ